MSFEYKISTIVVEDEEQNLNSICNKITSLDNEFEVVAKAVNGQEAIQKIEKYRPRVMFTDISMPEMDGMELIKKCKQYYPSMIIVIISGYSDFSYAQGAIKYGVFNYLLKPLENDILLETLIDIKQNLLCLGHNRKRHIAYAPNYQLLPDKEERVLIAAVCIGNIIYEPQDEEIVRHYSEQMKNLSWSQILEELCESKEWFVADEYVVNQKIVVIKIKENEVCRPISWAERLVNIIESKIKIPVNVCVVEETVIHEEIWNYVKRLRNTLRQKLIIGHNNVFLLGSEQQKNDAIEIVKVKLNAYSKNFYNSKNLDNFLNEVRMIFKYLRSNHVSQDSVAKICVYIINLLEFSDLNCQREKVEDIQYEIRKIISLIVNEEELYEALMKKIEGINYGDEQKEKRLIDYVDEHFLVIDSVEQVAEKFGYNYAYLSRLFKKQVGMSMNRYITAKKIDFAKKLICENKQLGLSEVSDLCGYEDYKYFSRVFKDVTGLTPNEYKEKMRIFNQ